MPPWPGPCSGDGVAGDVDGADRPTKSRQGNGVVPRPRAEFEQGGLLGGPLVDPTGECADRLGRVDPAGWSQQKEVGCRQPSPYVPRRTTSGTRGAGSARPSTMIVEGGMRSFLVARSRTGKCCIR